MNKLTKYIKENRRPHKSFDEIGWKVFYIYKKTEQYQTQQVNKGDWWNHFYDWLESKPYKELSEILSYHEIIEMLSEEKEDE